MVAKVDPSDAAVAEGERAALHRTYLDQFSGKAEVAEPRKMLGTMPTGAAVRLMAHDDVLGIAEGIETALSASILFNVPVLGCAHRRAAGGVVAAAQCQDRVRLRRQRREQHRPGSRL